MFGMGFFFEKIVNDLKLLTVFANDFSFDVSLGYEFAFEFALSQSFGYFVVSIPFSYH